MESTGTDDGSGVVRVNLDTEAPEPVLSVVDAVAEIEGANATDLAPIYDCIDHVIDGIFSNPPAPEADVEVSFDYEGYRVTVHQDGTATFVQRSG